MIFRNLKISKKLMLLISISMIFIGVVGTTGYIYMNQMANNTKIMYNDRLLPVKWLGQIQMNNRTIDSYLLELMITTDAERNKQLTDNIKTKLDEVDQLIGQYEKSHIDEIEKNKISEYNKTNQSFKQELQKAIDLALNDRNTEAYDSYTKNVKPLRSAANKLADDLSVYRDQLANDLNQQNTESLAKAVTIMVTTIIVAIGLCAAVGIVIYRLIVNPVVEIQTLMKKAENGDLTVIGTYQSRDEIGLLSNSFTNMIQGLRLVVKQITETSEMLAASSEELTASAEQTSKATEQITSTVQEVAIGTEKQVQSVEETSQTVNEMSLGIHQVASNAQNVSNTSILALEKAAAGNQAVLSAVEQMNSINHTVNDLVDIVSRLGEKSSEVGQIINVITEISAQTNLLSLNAAIEAARAGEHGRGFSVVSSEVRKLAEQSGSSATQIVYLISAIQEEISNMIQSMDKVRSEVLEGLKVVNLAGEAFNQIRVSTNDVSKQIQEVSSAAQQMLVGSDQIVHSIKLIAEVSEISAAGTQNVSAATQEQLATMEEIASSASSLSNMAEDLKAICSKFKI